MNNNVTATIRWIDERNANERGYPVIDHYETGTWVLEGEHDHWIADLGDLPDVIAVQHAAEKHLGLRESTWKALSKNGPTLSLVAYSPDGPELAFARWLQGLGVIGEDVALAALYDTWTEETR